MQNAFSLTNIAILSELSFGAIFLQSDLSQLTPSGKLPCSYV